ncbi:MAG: CPBP family intramembrane metalloprotease [Bacteroidetes bacterium]|nr:CPBP family intramembrane metalloprotease [Bacteroidota bacterium]
MEENKTTHTAPFKNINPVVYVFLGLVVVFFLYQIIGGLIQFMATGEDFSSTTGKLTLTRIIISFAQFMFILFPAVMLSYLQGDNVKISFRLKAPKISVFALSIVGIFVVQPFLQLYMYYQNKIIFSLPFGQDVLKQMKDLFDLLEASTLRLVTAYSFVEFLVIVLVIAVTPAICEEFLFRGFVLSNFEKVSKRTAAIFFSGLLFALFHFHPFNIIPLAILGIYLSFTVYHSGSIFTAIVCHFINNFISTAAVYFYGKEEFISKEIPQDEIMQVVIMGIVSLLIFTGIVLMIKKNSVTKNLLEINTPVI